MLWSVIEIISKFAFSAFCKSEEREGFIKAGREEVVLSLTNQIEVIKKYLPKLLSAEEIKEILIGLEDKSIPSVMRYFKTNYAGKVDMRLVQETLKSL